eukprot:365004-Chlamydomonas_euryale.AAC.10
MKLDVQAVAATAVAFSCSCTAGHERERPAAPHAECMGSACMCSVFAWRASIYACMLCTHAPMRIPHAHAVCA